MSKVTASGTQSAQVRIPIRGLFFYPPHLCSQYTTREELSSVGGRKIFRRRNNYPGRARVRQKFETIFSKKLTVPKNVKLWRKYPIPYPLGDMLCPKSSAIAYTLPKLYPISMHCQPVVLH